MVCLALPSLAIAQINLTNSGNDTAQPKPPLTLGGDASNDEPSAYSPNNSGVQSAATVPSLANPFFSNLINPPDDTSLKNGVPVSIIKLLKAKKNTEALKEIDAALEKNPKNVQLRFIRSRIFIEQGKSGAEAELSMAKKAYKEAYDAGDSDALVEAQMKIAEATLKLDKAQNLRPIEVKEQEYQIPQSTPEAPAQDPKLTQWLDENPWYGGDSVEEDEMTGLAITKHNQLAREFGEKYVGTADYYEKINATIRKRFPDHFQEQADTDSEVEAKPVKTRAKPAASVVAPATRSVAPKKVQLTPTQVQIAKRLGVPLELYAKKVAEQMNGDR